MIVAAGALAYANSLSGPFVFDDRGTIVDNPSIESLQASLRPPQELPTAGRPVVNLSFALNYAADGRDEGGYHAVNVAIHLACGLVLFGIASRLLGSADLGFASALIWTVHPLNTEAVSYVTQRTESLMALFFLVTVYASMRALRQPGRWTPVAAVACALGMASKETMVVAPIVVLLLDRVFYFISFRAAIRARWRLYAALAAGWIVLAAMLLTSPRVHSAGFTAHDADVWTYLKNQCVMIARYLWLAIWPKPLVLYYGWPQAVSFTAVLPYAALVALLLLGTAAAWLIWPSVGFFGAWFFLTLAPTSSIVPIVTEVGAERRMYLAMAALSMLGVLIASRWIRKGAPAVLAVVVILLGAGTVARNTEYQSSLRLAETSFRRWPTPGSRSMYGTELAAAGRRAEAEGHLRAVADAHPPARYYLATVLMAEGKRGEAVDHFRQYVDSQPAALDQAVLARQLLADTLTKEGRFEEAEAEYRRILELRPDDPQALALLSQILLRREDFEGAIAVYRKVVDSNPNDIAALSGLGIALASSGRIDDAIAVFQRAVEVDPRSVRAQQNLQRALAIKNKTGPSKPGPVR